MIAASRNAEKQLEPVFREMEKQARATLRDEGFADSAQRHERSFAARYKGQSFELQIKQTRGNVAAAFHRAHEARYGYAQEKNVVEIVSARVRSIGIVRGPRLSNPGAPERSHSRVSARPHDSVETYFDGKKIRAAVYSRDELRAGMRLRTPCIVTEYSATTLVPERTGAMVDDAGDLIIRL
jgi:N-methylhydantoinase A/oxoprolinase/acetone carboxylase beta subunit